MLVIRFSTYMILFQATFADVRQIFFMLILLSRNDIIVVVNMLFVLLLNQ